MWNEKYLKYWSDMWEYSMHHTENFSAEIRTKKEQIAAWNESAQSFDNGMGGDISRVYAAIDLIEKKGYYDKQMCAMDVGSGTGIFTIPFAKKYKEVYSFDVSSGMQDCIRKKAKEENIINIKYICKDWHELDLKREGLFKKFDMVLSSINCRGINNFEAINKMNQASKGGCCLITWAGPGENNHSKELNELVLGRQLKSEGGNDIIIPFNIIYSMGGMPELTYSTCCWEKKSTIDDAINQICNNYWRFIDITDEIKEKIKGYVVKNSHDGIYTEKAKHNVGIMVWDSWRIKD